MPSKISQVVENDQDLPMDTPPGWVFPEVTQQRGMTSRLDKIPYTPCPEKKKPTVFSA